MASVKGRLVYIEPNNIRADKGIHFGNGDNISWNQEDLNIAVDLQVIVPDRDNCGRYGVTDYFIANISSTDKSIFKTWQSYLSGNELGEDKSHFLTDSYTDISYQEIHRNKAGGKETLGIQSIDITFDSHFFPIVKMRMVDTRGYSLFSPAEKIYTDEHSRKESACQNFFSALFHYPYPRFALSIKGFFGDRVTFMLSLSDFKTTFNSTTGNFDVDIEFIGHMYGLYNDLPLYCILAGPYIGSKDGDVSDYWKGQTDPGSGKFLYSDGTPMMTFIELNKKYENLPAEYTKKYGEGGIGTQYESLGRVEQIDPEIDAINALKQSYINAYNSIGEGEAVKKVVTPSYVFIFSKSENGIIHMPDGILEKLYSAYEAYQSITPELPKNMKEEEWQYGKKTEPSLFNSEGKLLKTHSYFHKFSADTKTCNMLEALPSEVQSCNVFLYEIDNDFINRLTEQISPLEKEKAQLMGAASKEIIDVTKDVLGFSPTLENVFRMLFAHIDAFMTSFYNLLSIIDSKRDTTRKLRLLPSLKLANTDIDSKDTEDCFIPPFPGIYEDDKKSNKRVQKYPGEIKGLENMEEVDYIESIIVGIDGVRKNMGEEGIPTPMDEAILPQEPKQTWAPTSICDWFYDDNNNPYAFSIDWTNAVSAILRCFLLRMISAAGISKSISKNIPAEVITTEVENLINVLGDGLLSDQEAYDIIGELIGLSDSDLIERIQQYVNFKKFNIKINGDAIFMPIDENFPVSYSDTTSKKTIKTYGNIRGFTILGENEDNDYEKIKGIIDFDKIVNTTPEFKHNVGGIFACDDNGYLQTKVGRSKSEYSDFVLRTRTDASGNWYMPILEVGDNNMSADKKNLFYQDAAFILFNKEGNTSKNLLRIRSLLFVSTFISGHYSLKTEGSTIKRIPKYLALFLGGVIWRKKNGIKIYADENKSVELPDWIITSSGLYKGAWTANVRLREYNPGITIDELVKEDEQGGGRLEQYFLSWADRGFVYKVFNAKPTIANTIKLSDIGDRCFPSNSEIQNDLIDFYSTTVDLLNVKATKNGGTIGITAVRSFLSVLYNAMANAKTDDSTPETSEGEASENVNTERESGYARSLRKQQLYYTLKNLYDKWISTYNVNKFQLNSPDVDRDIAQKKNRGELPQSYATNEFQNFMFIDTFYNDIKEKFFINPEKIYKLLKDFDNAGSVLQFIGDLAFENKLLFIALPIFNNFYDSESLANVFTPQNLYNGTRSNARGIGSTYVLMYTHKSSSILSTNDNDGNSVGYRSDVLDIADTTGKINDVAITEINNNTIEGSNYTIPAFGVTFAKQNQMYFKGLSLGMENARETEVTVNNRFLLAGMGRKGEWTQVPSTIGQDIFSIYSNMAFDCTVEMMGCANIMPLMYFQLNNVPMFKGAYRVVNVKHHIEAGSMTTTFTGNRISKNAIQFNENVIDIEALMSKANAEAYEASFDYSNPDLSVQGYGGIFNPQTNFIEKSMTYENQPVNPPKPTKEDCVFDVASARAFFMTRGAYPEYEMSIYDKVIWTRPPCGKCATAVKMAVWAGFKGTELAKTWKGGKSGFYCYQILPELNFGVIENLSNNPKLQTNEGREEWTKTYAEPGDIAVMKIKGEESKVGHVCMFIGDCWISDFRQKGMLSNGSKVPRDIIIFRYAGKRRMPAGYRKISISNNVEGCTVNAVVKNGDREEHFTDETKKSFYGTFDVEAIIDVSEAEEKRKRKTINNVNIRVCDSNGTDMGIKAETEAVDKPKKATLKFTVGEGGISPEGDIIIYIS